MSTRDDPMQKAYFRILDIMEEHDLTNEECFTMMVNLTAVLVRAHPKLLTQFDELMRGYVHAVKQVVDDREAWARQHEGHA